MYPFRNESKDPENWEDDPEPVKATRLALAPTKPRTAAESCPHEDSPHCFAGPFRVPAAPLDAPHSIS